MSDRQQQIVDQLTDSPESWTTKSGTASGEVFTEDAEGYGQQGLAAITANTIRYLGRCGPTQHLTGNHRARLGGDRATLGDFVLPVEDDG